MGIKVNYVLFCDQAIVDIAGKVSLIGLFNNIYSNNVPAVHGKFTVVINSSGQPNTKHPLKIEIINTQDNQIVSILESNLEFKEAGTSNFFGNFINTILPIFGKYWIKITIDGDVINTKDTSYVTVAKN